MKYVMTGRVKARAAQYGISEETVMETVRRPLKVMATDSGYVLNGPGFQILAEDTGLITTLNRAVRL